MSEQQNGEKDATLCCICGARALHLIATPASAATGQAFYCDPHAAELLARAYWPRATPPAKSDEARP